MRNPSAQIDSLRHTRRAVFLIAVLYVAIGLAVAVLSLVRRDPLGTFLGFIIVSGANVAAVLLNSVLKVCAQADRVKETVDGVALGLARLEAQVAACVEAIEESRAHGPVRSLDLTGIGPGDPTMLAAATLNRSVYPRLVSAMEEEPPPDGAADREIHLGPDLEAGSGTPAEGPSTKNLLGQWKLALAERNLVACRAVFSALVDLASAEQLAPLRGQMEALGQQLEKDLRDRFTSCVRDRDFAGALLAGEEIGRSLADRPVAEEFRRLRPMLLELDARRHRDPAPHSVAH